MSIEWDKKCVVRYLLERNASVLGDKVFLHWDDRQRTFRDMDGIANRMANGFREHGIGKGDNVVIFMANRPEYIDTWFGLAKLGAVEVPVNNALTGNILCHVINNSEAAVIVTDDQLLPRILDLRDKFQFLKKLIIQTDEAETRSAVSRAIDAGIEAVPFQELLTCPDRAPPDPGICQQDIMAIIYTSGTTGPSKGVLVPYRQVYATYEALFKYNSPDDVYYNPLPLFHLSGQYCYYRMLVIGGSVVGRDKFSRSAFWEDIDRYGCTDTLLISSMAHYLHNQPERNDDALHSLKRVSMVPLIEDIEGFMKRFDVEVCTGYNMTEVSMPICTDGYTLIDNRSCGRVRPGVQVRIVNEQDEVLSPNQVGELIVRADEPWTMNAGYWKMPDKTVEAWRNQWLHTGDAFYADEIGNYYFVDRLKDAIRYRGENISSMEVELEINSHPSVAESAVIAVSSEHLEDEIKAVIVLLDGCELSPEALIRYLERRLPYYMVPRYIEFRRELPKTPTAKIRKQTLRSEGIGEDTWDRIEAGIELER